MQMRYECECHPTHLEQLLEIACEGVMVADCETKVWQI